MKIISAERSRLMDILSIIWFHCISVRDLLKCILIITSTSSTYYVIVLISHVKISLKVIEMLLREISQEIIWNTNIYIYFNLQKQLLKINNRNFIPIIVNFKLMKIGFNFYQYSYIVNFLKSPITNLFHYLQCNI